MRKAAVEKRQPIGARAGRCGSFPTIPLAALNQDAYASKTSPLIGALSDETCVFVAVLFHSWLRAITSHGTNDVTHLT
jgi:hypothetical protein